METGYLEVVELGNLLGDSVVEAHDQHTNDADEEEVHYASGSAAKFQPRKITSKAHWNDGMGMAEVVVEKGNYRITTGVVRSSKLYYSIEEVLFLVEIGDLLLLDDTGSSLSLEDIYMKMSDGNNGCCWEEFQAYRQLKSLGYIVGQHGIPWSMKSVKSNYESVSSQGCLESEEVVDLESEETRSVIGLLNNMQINDARLVFDVYLPNSKFRKSAPGDPSFVLCFTRGHPPSKADLEALERQCDGIPLKVFHAEQGSSEKLARLKKKAQQSHKAMWPKNVQISSPTQCYKSGLHNKKGLEGHQLVNLMTEIEEGDKVGEEFRPKSPQLLICEEETCSCSGSS